MAGWGVNVGVGGGSQKGSNTIRYRGDNAGLGAGGPLNTLLFGALSDYLNSGALSDMILGGRGFGQSRRFRQYDPFDPTYGYKKRPHGSGSSSTPPGPDGAGGTPRGTPRGQEGGPHEPWAPRTGEDGPVEPWDGAGQEPYRGNPDPGKSYTDPGKVPVDGGAGANMTMTLPPGEGGDAPPDEDWQLGPGATPNPGGEYDYNDEWRGYGTDQNPAWMEWDDAPVEGEGLLGDIGRYGEWNGIEQDLLGDLGWQASGDLMDLENRELGLWERFGNQNQLEKALESDIGWQRSGELSDLEQQEKWGWKDVAGPGQYDELRGKTLTGMVEKPGLSEAEKGAMLSSQVLPIRQALEEQNRAGDARVAASGNAAGRWGASNAASLAAAGQAGQAGRNVQMAAADYMRKDRGEGLQGLGGLQGQIDARKVQGTTGLSNLAGRQRQNQQFGIQAGMGLNEQQRGAQAQAAQGVGNLGQRQRQNTQWGLGAIADLNKQKSDQQLGKIGLQKDLWDSMNQKGQQGADLAARIGSLVAGGQNASGSSSWNAGVSV